MVHLCENFPLLPPPPPPKFSSLFFELQLKIGLEGTWVCGSGEAPFAPYDYTPSLMELDSQNPDISPYTSHWHHLGKYKQICG